MKININIRVYLGLLLRYVWLLLLAFVVALVGSYFMYEYPKQPVYTSQATMYVKSSSEIDQKYYSSAESYAAQALIKTCSVAVKSDTVATQIQEKLADTYPELSAAMIKGCMNIDSVNETEIMSITATTGDPKLSVDICNAAMDVVPQMLLDVIEVGKANVLDRATYAVTSNVPSFRTPILYGVMAAVAVAGIIFLIFILDTRIKSSEEIVKMYKLPVLGEIPNFNQSSGKRYGRYGRYARYSNYMSYGTKEEK